MLLLVPLGAIAVLRIVDADLVEATERRLIAEAVTVGEAYRDALRAAEGLPPAAPSPPTWAEDDRYWPIAPVVDPRRPRAPEPPRTTRTVPPSERTGPRWTAGEALRPMLQRAQRINLAGLRVLDPTGCVVASSGGELGDCLEHLPEVGPALAGRYAAVGRDRISDEPTPPLTSMRRRGGTRLFVAVPVLHDGEVVAVVRASRTARDPREAAWEHRGSLLPGLLVCLGITGCVSWFLTRRIVGPVRALTTAATQAAKARPGTVALPPSPPGAPAEVQDLATALTTMTARLSDHALAAADSAASVSHELKTPLTAVRGAVELLRDSWAEMSSEQRDRFLANIDADAERMQRLATGLLRLARIEAAPSGGTEPTAVGPVLQALAARHPERVRLTLTDGLPPLDFAREHLESAVGNLVENALRHGGDGPVQVRATRTAGGRLQIEVQDRGPGIPEAHRAQMFDRFFTTARDSGGTGLGLAIVAAVVQLRGGRIEVESGAAGTVVRVVL